MAARRHLCGLSPRPPSPKRRHALSLASPTKRRRPLQSKPTNAAPMPPCSHDLIASDAERTPRARRSSPSRLRRASGRLFCFAPNLTHHRTCYGFTRPNTGAIGRITVFLGLEDCTSATATMPRPMPSHAPSSTCATFRDPSNTRRRCNNPRLLGTARYTVGLST